ncbi:usher protein [Escherichia coli]|nr:usher protein [Escherichia coli]
MLIASVRYGIINGGINLGAWQYRQLSNITWDNDKGNQWNNIRSYLQRPAASHK